MLITNTPNSELHIYNNDGEEIVTIDGTGVAKPEIGGGGSPEVVTFTYDENQGCWTSDMSTKEIFDKALSYKVLTSIIVNNNYTTVCSLGVSFQQEPPALEVIAPEAAIHASYLYADGISEDNYTWVIPD